MPPNIILITTDQQRGDCLGIAGNEAIQTPNLDALAASGTYFRRGSSECPSCFPARRSLMSGMSPAGQGMVGMQGIDEWKPPFTLPGLLHDAGYHSYLVGKLHLQPTGKRFGFDHQELADGSMDPNNAYVRWLRERWGRKEVDAAFGHGVDPNGWIGRPGHLPEEQTMTWWCMERAIDFLKNTRDPTSPFFLNVSIFDPHPPLVPPTHYYDRYVHRDLPPPAIGDWAEDPGLQSGYPTAATRMHLRAHDMQCLRAAYYATINFIDDQIGRLLQHLRRNGLDRDTMIIFASDHGEMLGDHYLFRKCWPYEASTRVPFIVKLPPSMDAPSGIASDCPVGLQDVLPTCLSAAGVPAPEIVTGKDLMPICRGQTDSVRDMLHLEDGGTYTPDDGYHALLSERYKYVWYSQRQTEHLFDLAEDANETRDLTLTAEAETLLAPWRGRMVEVLRDRPEGFVEGDQLVRGKASRYLIPNYEPDRFYPYL